MLRGPQSRRCQVACTAFLIEVQATADRQEQDMPDFDPTESRLSETWPWSDEELVAYLANQHTDVAPTK